MDSELEDTQPASLYNLQTRISGFRFVESPGRKLRGGSRNPTKSIKPESSMSTAVLASPTRARSLKATGALTSAVAQVVTPTRTSPRKRTKSEPDGNISDELLQLASFSPSQSPSKKRKTDSPRLKRGFAPPETYVHLIPLQDYLADGLDVLFCGINPGERSAIVGHHFANPTNHFWRCLAGSGLTDKLLLPSEDFSLPEKYNIGLTNLVDRPSKEEAELAPSEFTDGVPVLLQKIARYRPRIVCFVGKGIWEAFERALPVHHPKMPVQADGEQTPSSLSRPPSSPRKGKGRRGQKAEPFKFDLQPFKFVHADPDTDSGVQETLFFVSPSSSGRVTSHQLPQKITLFTLLKQRVEESKQDTTTTEFMTIIPPP